MRFAALALVLLLCCPALPARAADPARPLPEVYVEKTMCKSGCDFSDAASWETWSQGQTDTGHVLSVQEDLYTTGVVVFSGFPATAAKFRVMRAAPGAEHHGRLSAGVRFEVANSIRYVIRIQEGYVGLYDFAVKLTTGYASTGFTHPVWVNVSGTDPVRMAGMLLYDSSAAGGLGNYGVYVDGGTLFAADCWLKDTVNGFYANGATYGNGVAAYNCIVTNCAGTAFSRDAATMTLTNCLSYANGADWSGTMTRTACKAGADLSASDFLDAAGFDFHLAAGSSCVNAGADASAYVTHDVDGEAFGIFDIGFDEYPMAAAAGGPPWAFGKPQRWAAGPWRQ
ncbi:MAG: hypothetical protein AB1921_16050 [Thermodesulfobacteriota bacterium]